jgi:hypothetical protein
VCTALVYKNEMDCSTAYVYILRVCITLYVHIESSILIYKIIYLITDILIFVHSSMTSSNCSIYMDPKTTREEVCLSLRT